MSEIGIKELAQKLGISTASVSRALSNPERVSKKMRELVEKAAREVGYRPNRLGASLRTSKTKNIIAIIPDITSSFNSGVIRSIGHTAADYGYSVLYGSTEGSREKELNYGDMARSKQADGIICFSSALPFTEQALESEHFTLPPIVNACEQMSSAHAADSNIPFITIDDTAASKELVTHLISLGHTRIALISGNMLQPSAQKRMDGYRQALAEAGLAYDQDLVWKGDYTLDAGRTVTQEIIKSKSGATAIFCMCDETALGSLNTLQENGFDVPKDYSVVGFDDIKYAEFFSPALTTISQPVESIGKRCVEVLMELIKGEEPSQKLEVIPHQLAVRDSSGQAPKR